MHGIGMQTCKHHTARYKHNNIHHTDTHAAQVVVGDGSDSGNLVVVLVMVVGGECVVGGGWVFLLLAVYRWWRVLHLLTKHSCVYLGI